MWTVHVVIWNLGSSWKITWLWQNFVPCSCKTEVFISLLAVSQRLLSKPSSKNLPCLESLSWVKSILLRISSLGRGFSIPHLMRSRPPRIISPLHHSPQYMVCWQSGWLWACRELPTMTSLEAVLWALDISAVRLNKESCWEMDRKLHSSWL